MDPAYRGFKGGAAFFGWLVAIGLIALLTGIVGAVAAAVDYAVTIDWNAAEAEAGTIGIVSGAVLLLILAIAYYNGGYVAGRLARFDGGRQGLGVWLIGVLVTLAVAAIAALAGSQYDVLDRVDLPSMPFTDETLTTGGLIAIARGRPGDAVRRGDRRQGGAALPPPHRHQRRLTSQPEPGRRMTPIRRPGLRCAGRSAGAGCRT